MARESANIPVKAIKGFKAVKDFKDFKDFKGFKAVRGFKGLNPQTTTANSGNTIAVGLLMHAKAQQTKAAADLPLRQANRPMRAKNAHSSSLRDAIQATASTRCG